MHDILDELVAKGVSGFVIVRVAALITEVESFKAEIRFLQEHRARDAERKRRWRDRVRGPSADCPGTVTGPPPAYILPPPVEKPKKVSLHARGRFPTDWKLTDVDRAYATSKGWSQQRTDSEAERFRDYWLANGKSMSDWAACWRKWVTSPYQNGNGNGGQNGHGRRHGSVLDAADRLIDQLGGEEAARSYVPGSSGPTPLKLDNGNGPPNLRVIPKR